MPFLPSLLMLATALALLPAAAQAQQQPAPRTQPRGQQAVPPPPPSPPAPTMPDAPIAAPVIPPASPVPAVEAPVAPAPLMPLAPPGPPVIPPPLAVPTRPAPPPPVIEIVAGAPGGAARIGDGWRITFGPGLSSLSPATAQVLRDVARGLPAQASLTISAFAQGSPEDPSVARRLSLARALATRGVLIAEGIASPRIIVRALGASPPIADGPPDRADLAITLPRPAP
ncbi:MAG: OmpA family protein [Alphaproteobacteria bacterium]|nr:OmpA family protein [Alphaproteobacteria bacterium]